MNCANHPDRERTAFCQNCGKPICQECTRTVGTSVFCEPCLAARIAPPPTGGGSYTYTGGTGGLNYTVSGAIPPPGAPNPALAALLGVIPGVGAMYNGQFAKGIVHLVIFAVLVSLSHENGIFGLFIAGWVCYQIIEAYHTARARRDGTPLPNPFGLNDLGERFGFGKSWTATHPSAPTEQPPAAPPVPPAVTYGPPASQYPPPQHMPWETQWTDYGNPASGPGSPGWTSAPPANPYTAPPVPPAPPYDPTAYRNRFPMGAIWLIGLGLLFLIGNAGLFHGFPMHFVIPVFLIGLGVWLFIHKMTLTGPSLADDGSTYYRVRLFSALRGSVWVILVGVMFLLSSLGILSWGRSWPLFIIVAGLMAVFEKTAYSSGVPSQPAGWGGSSAAASGGPWYPPQQPPPMAPPAPPAEPNRPSSTNDQEER